MCEICGEEPNDCYCYLNEADELDRVRELINAFNQSRESSFGTRPLSKDDVEYLTHLIVEGL